jgi:N-acetylmuramoyl-L-alanine amidase
LISLAKIFIDVGHGGKDGGAVGNGLKEKDMNLDIALRIKKGLQAYENAQILMSRETDEYLTLDERTIKANQWNADLLVSIHCNASTNVTADGFESYVYTSVPSATKAFQNVLHNEIIKAMGSGIEDRGKKSKNLHMVRESKMNAVLTENLFISNASDAKKLADASFRQKVANGHVLGIANFLGLKKEATEAPKNDGKLYKVQVGAFEEEDNAEALANDLRKQGYRPYIKYE